MWQRPIRREAARRFGLTLLIGLSVAGCAGRPAAPRPEAASGEAPVVVVADWSDLEAAVLIGASEAEMAVLGDRGAEGERTFRLLTIRDETAELRASTDQPDSERPVPIALRARIGPFGDPVRERALVGAVAERLRDLAGVDYRPLD